MAACRKSVQIYWFSIFVHYIFHEYFISSSIEWLFKKNYFLSTFFWFHLIFYLIYSILIDEKMEKFQICIYNICFIKKSTVIVIIAVGSCFWNSRNIRKRSESITFMKQSLSYRNSLPYRNGWWFAISELDLQT